MDQMGLDMEKQNNKDGVNAPSDEKKKEKLIQQLRKIIRTAFVKEEFQTAKDLKYLNYYSPYKVSVIKNNIKIKDVKEIAKFIKEHNTEITINDIANLILSEFDVYKYYYNYVWNGYSNHWDSYEIENKIYVDIYTRDGKAESITIHFKGKKSELHIRASYNEIEVYFA